MNNTSETCPDDPRTDEYVSDCNNVPFSGPMSRGEITCFLALAAAGLALLAGLVYGGYRLVSVLLAG